MTEAFTETQDRKKLRRWPWFVAIGAVLLLLTAALKTSRLGYESPDYEVVEEDEDFELRRYTGFTTVTATMDNPTEMNRGFGRLFSYITGDNETQQKIAMTVPVLMTESPDTAETKASPTMSFVLPAEVALKGAPDPSGKNVSLTKTAAGEFAALRFDGFRKEEAIQNAEQKLRSWIRQQGWKVMGKVRIAYYDPPWTPGILRRNEVLIPVER